MRSKVRRLIVALTVAGALVIGGSVAFGATFGIKATDGNRWKPAHRYISKGDLIRWRNPSPRRHAIKSYGGNWSYSKGLPKGETRSRRFKSVGTFRYRCTIHSTLSGGACSGMCGIIHVFS